MIRLTRALGIAALASLAAAPAAEAHFQLVYTPEVNVEKAGNLPFRLIFWHPMENAHVMDMGQPEDVFVVTKDGKQDLKAALKPITFKGSENSAKAFALDLPVKKNGDYVVAVVPAPYLEKSEDVFIQQITKSFVNKGGLPTNWAEPVGLPTEIVPLNKPTNILAGSTFSGVVLSEGKPVAGAEIEIEYIAAAPDMKTNSAPKPSVQPPAGGAIVAVTDENGVFTFGIPKAGFWGFAALGTGPAKELQGKELSQDAVIWIRAYDFK
ncbi:Additional periplasmic component NikK of nickel ECF transporter [uncultured Alphaproteobacteria bacterium]|uniref:Additional periplasmic component NikK of nickel ECF transporter n=1 Tax=uncultured Alphaproteobacteria bacterium TaxID=91750 RepID=A0A212KI63_9PROT|nr:Additional periplasmic component NikK of nickel ECF transporter [uncultured Alphaproteobacteria bacterium]